MHRKHLFAFSLPKDIANDKERYHSLPHITVEIEFVDTLIKPDKDRLSLTSNKRKTERERRVGVDDRQR